MIDVSIIVPVYNVEKYLDKCLSSIKNQSLKNIEVIVVNDGTKDNSQKIIDKYVKEDKRFTSYIKENGGLSDARNYGMKYAKGKYLAFIDSDDYIEHDMFEKMYNAAEKNDADVVECDFVWEYPKKNVIDKTKIEENDLIDIRVIACNKIYRKKLIDKINVKFSKGIRYEDVDWCYKIIPFMNKIVSVKEPLYHYVQRNDSISNNQNEKVKDIYIALQNIIDYYKENKIYDKYKVELEYLHIRILLGSSFLRILDIKDKILRNSILKENWTILNERFPNWKKNDILKSRKDKKNLYYKLINYPMYKICSYIFRLRRR